MSRPARLATVSLLAALVIGGSSLAWLHPRLSLRGPTAHPSPTPTVLRIGTLSIRSVPLDGRQLAAVRSLVGVGLAVEEIDAAPARQAEFGPSVNFVALRTVDAAVLLGTPAGAALSASACQRPDGITYDVRINGAIGTDTSRYPEWWLSFDGAVLLTSEGSTYALLRHAGATDVPCQKVDTLGWLHIDGLAIQAPALLPAEVDTLHRAISAGLVPTEVDRVVGTPTGLFVHLVHGALVIARSCDDVRALARATHLIGNGDPAEPDFLGVGRLGEMSVATADPPLWEVLGRSVGPC